MNMLYETVRYAHVQTNISRLRYLAMYGHYLRKEPLVLAARLSEIVIRQSRQQWLLSLK